MFRRANFRFSPGNSSVAPRATLLFINNNVAGERRAPDKIKNRAIIGNERVVRRARRLLDFYAFLKYFEMQNTREIFKSSIFFLEYNI